MPCRVDLEEIGYRTESGTKVELDLVTKLLCDVMTTLNSRRENILWLHSNIKYSKELKKWWEQHQRMDAVRIKKESEQEELIKKKALNKLTRKERELLGLPLE